MIALLKTRSRSALPKTKTKSKAETEHLGKVAALGCIICKSPANVHHIRIGQGMGQKASHYETIPLCHNHHQGKEGIHTLGTKVWQKKYGNELDFLAQVKEGLMGLINKNTKVII